MSTAASIVKNYHQILSNITEQEAAIGVIHTSISNLSNTVKS